MTIGERIQNERRRLGLSQEELGELVGVSRQAVSKWELDTALPDLDNLVALSRAFSISTDELLGNEEPPRATLADESPAAPRNDVWGRVLGFVERNWHRLGYLLILWGAIVIAGGFSIAVAWRKMFALSIDFMGMRGVPSLWSFAFDQPVLPIILVLGFLAVALGAFVVIYGTIKNKKANRQAL